ncbi:MAG: hypothetical protein APR63_01480 [Desulfuromonas sp. SDB]|nr:MAG: hypothetical protein APR63_01480 [Desulfuromonas sp. SDB]
MNLWPDRQWRIAWVLMMMTVLGYLIGKPLPQSYQPLGKEIPTVYAHQGEEVIMVLDFSLETWDEMSPVMFSFLENFISRRHQIYLLSTNLDLCIWLEKVVSDLNRQSLTEEQHEQVFFSGFLPGIPGSIIEIMRDPSLITENLNINNPEQKLWIVFSDRSWFHQWIFYGWARYHSRIILVLPNKWYPEGYIYEKSGQVDELYQSYIQIEDKRLNRRKSAVVWFVWGVILISLIRLMRIPVHRFKLRQFKQTHKKFR